MKNKKIHIRTLSEITADNPADEFKTIDRLENSTSFSKIKFDETQNNKYILPVAKNQKQNGKTVIAETEKLRLSFKQKQGGANKLVIWDVDLFLYEGEVLALCC